MTTGCFAAALLATTAGAACAQTPAVDGPSWGVTAGVAHRRLVERAANGDRLLKESGPMLRLALDAQMRVGAGGALRAELGVATGKLDYDGQTQGGAPVSTDSRHRDLDFTLGYRPLSAATWGEGWLVLRALQQRRRIASTATVGGLDETSTLWMPGLRWTHTLDAGGWRVRPSVELRASVHHDLEIDYGGVFDASDLKGGRRREIVLGLDFTQAGSAWQWGIEWTRSRQSASPSQALHRGGIAVGSVRQPRVEIDDVTLRVRRAF
jgi:hypothetical protein